MSQAPIIRAHVACLKNELREMQISLKDNHTRLGNRIQLEYAVKLVQQAITVLEEEE